MSTEYVEVVLEGSFDLIKGFVIGFLEGRGIQGDAVFEKGRWIKEEGEPFVQLLRLVRLKEEQVHLIVDREIHELLKEAVEKRERDIPVKIVSVRKVKEARFEFHYHIYSRQLDVELNQLLLNLPAGLRLEGYKPRETFRPEAEGIEAYAPEHAYEAKGSGTVRGGAKELAGFYNLLMHYEAVELGEITMDFEEKSP